MSSDKPRIILLDVDGVLNDLDNELLDIIRPGTTEAELETIKGWNVEELLDEEQSVEVYKLMSKGGFWESLKPYEAAQKAVEEIRTDGDEVIFVTSPWLECKGWPEIRIDWLKKHFGAKGSKDIVITARKEFYRGDVFIDDRSRNVEKWKKQWSKYNGYGLMFEKPMNKKEDMYPRITVVDGLWKIVKDKQ